MVDTARTKAALLTLFGDAVPGGITPQSGRDLIVSVYPSIVNVLNYGAVGDGVTDDSAAFQAANDAVSLVGGGSILCPGGYTYFLHSQVQYSKMIRVVGEGWSTVVTGDAATLFAAPTDPDLQTGGTIIVRDIRFRVTKTSAAQKIISADVTYTAGDASIPLEISGCLFEFVGHIDTIGVWCRGVDVVDLHNSYFYCDGPEAGLGSFRGIGLYCHGDAGGNPASLNINVDDCQFIQLDRGVLIEGVVEGISFSNSKWVGCITQNISCVGPGILSVQVDTCLIDSTHCNGLNLDGCTAIFIQDNWIAPNQTGNAGINITTTTGAVDRLIILGNYINTTAGIPGNGIAFDTSGNASQHFICSNNIFGGWSTGVIFGGLGTSYAIINDNIFSNCVHGIDLGNVVTNYTLSGNQYQGVTENVVNQPSWALSFLWSTSVGANNVRFGADIKEYPLTGTVLLDHYSTAFTIAAPAANTTIETTISLNSPASTGYWKVQFYRIGGDALDTNTGSVSIWGQNLVSPSGQRQTLMSMNDFSAGGPLPVQTDVHGTLIGHSHFHFPNAVTTYANFERPPVEKVY